MSLAMSEHPPTSDLAGFALGKLDGPSAERVQAHLDTCIACRTIAEQTPADSLVNLLGRAGSPRTAAYAPTPSGQGPEVPTLTPAPSSSSSDLPPALRDHPRYRILRLLGRGGMGVVYQAEHKVMERLVAVKVISQVLVERPEALERFHREVRAAAKLDHPNIVKAYDAEQAGDLQLLAMEYVEGKSLADVLHKRGPLPISNACHYVRQAALGLQHAFERGMVHRDLKPQNLMLTPKGVVKVLDFGLAKLASESARPGGGLTQDHMVMGTPEYMAPEQALNSKTADVRADIYALGCTLYCLLTGRPPFAGESLAIIVAHSTDAPPPVESLRPDTPPELAALVARCLAKKPADRPQTPKELAEALVPFSRAASKSAPSPTTVTPAPTSRPASGPNNRRWFIPSAVAAGLLLAVGVVAGVIMWVKVPGGVVRLEVEPADAKVEVVDGKITVSRAGDAEPWRIEMAGEKGQLKISKAGFVVQTRDVTLGEKGQTIRVELKPDSPPVAANDGFVSLFNGKDLTGWVVDSGDKNAWGVKNGELVVHAAEDDSWWNQGYLLTERDYADFHLRFQFQQSSDTALSGIALRAVPHETMRDSDPGMIGRDTPFHLTAAIGMFGGNLATGALWWSPNTAGQDPLSPDQLPHVKPNGEWNDMEVQTRGQSLRIVINGREVQNVMLNKTRPQKFPAVGLNRFAGRIGFLKRAGEVWFRKIEIKELPTVAAVDAGPGGPLAKTFVARPPPEQRKAETPAPTDADDPDRKAAEWAQALGGIIWVRETGTEREIRAGGTLPATGFQLTKINLYSKTVRDSDLALLEGLMHLRVLNLERTTVSDAGLKHLKGLTNLTELRLFGCPKVSDTGLEHLKDLVSLKRLDVGTQVTDDGLIHLKAMTDLNVLDLIDTQVTGVGLVHLKALPNLNVLWLRNSKVRDAGLVDIGDLTNLVELGLDDTKLSDAGLMHLKDMTNLTRLWLSNTKISDSGLAHLKSLTNLRALSLAKTRVTANGVAELKADLPDCNITR
jgi:hypothetical protein